MQMNSSCPHSTTSVVNMSQFRQNPKPGSKLRRPIIASVVGRNGSNFFESLQMAIASKDLSACEEVLRNKRVDLNSNNDPHFLHPLLFAAKRGVPEIVSLLLAHGANIDVQDKTLLSALHYAIQQKNQDVCFLLLERDITTGLADFQNNLPLHLATIKGMEVIVRKLLDMNADPNIPGQRRKTPVHFAAEEGHINILNILIQRGGKWDAEDIFLRYPLHWCALNNFYDCCRALLSASGGDQVKKQTQHCDKKKRTPLFLAAEAGNWQCCQLLLHTSDVASKDSSGNTALHYAAMGGYCRAVEILLKRSQLLTPNTRGNTQIHCLIIKFPKYHSRENAQHSYFRCLEILMNKFTEDVKLNKLGQSLLHLAAKINWVTALKLLLDKDQHLKYIDTRDKEGDTPFNVALKFGHAEAANVLLESGCNVSIKNNNNDNSLNLAASKGMEKVCKRIILKIKKTENEYLEVQNNEKKTPLHYAAISGSTKCCKLLYYQNPTVDSQGYSPFHYAVKGGYIDVVKLLANRNRKGITEEVAETGDNALHLSVRGGWYDCCEFLLGKMNTNSITKQNWQGRTAFDEAFHLCRYNHFALILSKIPKVFKKNNESLLQFQASLHEFTHAAIDNKNRSLWEIIIKSAWWWSGFSSQFCARENRRSCPNLNILVYKEPKLAEIVFDQCLTEADKTGTKLYNFCIFETSHFVEVPSTKPNEAVSKYVKRDLTFDDEGNFLVKKSIPFPVQREHPLIIAVNCYHSKLLKHPLTQAYLNYRWDAHVQNVLFSLIAFEVVVFIILATFISKVWNWTVLEKDPQFTATNITKEGLCSGEDSLDLVDTLWGGFVARFSLATFVTVAFILQEVFFWFQLNHSYSFASMFRFIRMAGCLLLVLPLTNCLRYSIAIKEVWQWESGILALLFSWFQFLHLLNKIPRLSLVTPLTYQFFKGGLAVLLYIVLIIGIFAFIFSLLFPHNPAFQNIFASFMKTTVWFLGDLAYEDTFLNEDYPLLYPHITNFVFMLLITCITGFIINLFIYLPADFRDHLREEALFCKIARQIRLTIDLDMYLNNKKLKSLNIYWKEDQKNDLCQTMKEKLLKTLHFSPNLEDMQSTSDDSKFGLIDKALEDIKQQNNGLRVEIQELKKRIAKT